MKLFTIDDTKIEIEEGMTLIPKESFTLLLEASDTLQKAIEFKEKSLKEIEEIEKAAKERGLALGKKSAEEAFFKQMINFEEKLQLMEQNFKDKLIALTIKCTNKLFTKQVEYDPALVLDIIKESTSQVIDNKVFKFIVSPDDFEYVDEHKRAFLDLLSHFETAEVIRSPEIQRGECTIETESGKVSMILKDNLDSLQSVLEEVYNEK